MSNNTLDLRAPHQETEPPAPKRRFSLLRRLRLRHYAVIAGVVVLAGGVFAFTYYHAPIPHSVRHGVNFTLYYPKQLPAGYKVDPGSFKNQDGVVIFSIQAPGGKNIAVSEQSLPLNLALRPGNNAPVKIPGEEDFTAPVGKGHIGFWSEKYVADILTENTWIILNVGGFTAGEAVPVAQSFRRL